MLFRSDTVLTTACCLLFEQDPADLSTAPVGSEKLENQPGDLSALGGSDPDTSPSGQPRLQHQIVPRELDSQQPEESDAGLHEQSVAHQQLDEASGACLGRVQLSLHKLLARF